MRLEKIIACGVVLFGLIFVTQTAYAYDDATTHPALTNEIVNFYNLTHPASKLTDEERGWLIEGSRLEDTPPRWINHFYDPVHKVGWTGENTGALPAEFVQLIARFGLSQNKPLSTLEWVKSDTQGIEYSRYGGDGTWTKAVDAYLSEDKKNAYLALGHVLHLLEDMGVPDHTRNDTHAPIVGVDESSPLESYATQFDINGIKKLNIAQNLASAKTSEIAKPSIEESFASLAEYSNKYFFSKDTINDPKFNAPKIVEEKNGFGYGVDEKGKEFLLVAVKTKSGNEKNVSGEYSLKDSKGHWPVYNSYFLRLSKQVVLRGAGVIDLFYAGMDDARIAKDIPQHLYKYDRSVFTFPTFSIYGELVNLGNLIGVAFTNAGDFIAGLGGKTNSQNNSVDTANTITQTSDTDASIIPEGDTFSYSDEPESPTLVVVPVVAPITTSTNASTTLPKTNDSATSTVASSTKANTSSTTKYTFFGGGSTGSTKVLGCVAGGIAITEIMYDALGSDDGKEWVEIYNNGTSNITVTDMKLTEGGTNHSIKSVRGSSDIGPSAYAILASDGDQFIADHAEYAGQVFHSAFSLSNDGENVALKCGDSLLDNVTYATSTGASGDGKSLQVLDAIWRAATPTPGRATSQSQMPYATFSYSPTYPMADENILFDASSSTGGVGVITLYSWEFGDGVTTSSTSATSTHVFSDAKGYEVRLVVTDEAGATSSKTAMIDVSPYVPRGTDHVVISEIEVSGAKANDEFIELYNPTAKSTPLTGYSIQYASGRATSTDKIRSTGAKKNFDETAIIQPHSFYLLVNSGATSSLKDRADMPYSSFSLSGDSTGGAVFLVNTNTYISGVSDETIVDSVAYGDVTLSSISSVALPATGKSLERKANVDATTASMASGTDKFLGNGYDSNNNTTDFVVRDVPEPQNAQNYPESRATPTVPVGPDGTANTIGNYSEASSSILFAWQDAKDFLDSTSSVAYDLYAIDDTSSTRIAQQSSNTYTMAVPDATHTYGFGLRACDAEGLCSATSTFSVLVRKNAVPIAAFSISPSNPRLGDVVTFDAASSTDSDGSIVSYDWDFDDGMPAGSLGVMNTHVFDIVGTHNIILLVKDNEGATSSLATSLVIAPKLEVTTSTFMLSQEDFNGGNVVNIGFTGGTQFQYLGTRLNGTVTSISVYMAQMNYGGARTSLSARFYESETLDGTSRVVVANMYHDLIIADGVWVTFGLNYVLNPNKHYWLATPSIETSYLHQNPAKSSVVARYPYNAKFIFWYPETFDAGAGYDGLTAESGSLAYRVSGTLP